MGCRFRPLQKMPLRGVSSHEVGIRCIGEGPSPDESVDSDSPTVEKGCHVRSRWRTRLGVCDVPCDRGGKQDPGPANPFPASLRLISSLSETTHS